MKIHTLRLPAYIPLLVVANLVLLFRPVSAQKKALTFTDIMKFRQIESPVISDDGKWVSYVLQPDRGDGEAMIHSLESGKVFAIPRGVKPVFSKNARWVAMGVKPTAVEIEKKEKDKDAPKVGMALVNTGTGDTVQVPAVQSFTFSEDSRWLVYSKAKVDKKPDPPGQLDAGKDTSQSKSKGKENVGTDLILRELASGKEARIPFVASYAIDSVSHFLAYTVADTIGGTNGVYVRNLRQEGQPERSVLTRENGTFTHLTWSNANGKLAFVGATMDDKEKPGPASLWLLDPTEQKAAEIVTLDAAPVGWILPSKNDLAWSKDGKRLFFGFRPLNQSDKRAEEAKDTTIDLFDIDAILKKRGVDVWGWNDPRIIPNQKKRWKDVKDQIYQAVYNIDAKQFVSLASPDLPYVDVAENPDVALGRSNVPYLKELTWGGEFNDIFLVDLKNGTHRKVVSRLGGPSYLSPSGKFVLYYQDRNWFSYNVNDSSTRNLTGSLKVAFYDEEDDTPDPPSAYGFAGWVDEDRSVLLYDRYDIWKIPTVTGPAQNITDGAGRKNELTFRIQRLNPDEKYFKEGEHLLLTAYHDKKKFTAFYAATIGAPGVERLVEEPKRFEVLAKAKNSNRIMYTRESYTEFPDVWAGDLDLKSRRKISDANPQIKDFAWGSAEPVEWNSLDGMPLQGVLIKPGNYETGKRYPVLVYYYELSSQRLYEFNQVVINHRPCFPFYASNGYAIFLPDVRFEIGSPGFSATKCVVPGVQKLIDMGIADPKAIALHGHSWSGYETAFMVTQTNIFAAAIAGAPVANMTSAYSGIRFESGLARQFQYEEEQSRIGGSLWQYRDRYIENSPVFYADKIKTPLLIELGDEDEAVPWQQGVEMYLAMRRLNKPCWMLEYRGEAHHLKNYPNKLDYSIRFKEFLDHYLKGMPAPDWLTKGVPYSE